MMDAARHPSSALKWHGGKTYLAQRIVQLMPPRARNSNRPASDDPGWLHYVEPFFGGGAVLFAMDPEGISEVVNDLDRELTDFWRCLQDPEEFAALVRLLEAVPCSQVEFREAAGGQSARGRVARAAAFFIRNRQSRQALGRDFSTLAKNRTRRGMNELPSAWLSAIEGLPEVHARLKRVVILNEDALKVIRQQDGPRTLFYLDPPYVPETRHNGGGEYRYEMSVEQHKRLLETLSGIEGRFLLSGYRCPLYYGFEKRCRWRRVDIEIDNKASGRKQKVRKVESIWMNY